MRSSVSGFLLVVAITLLPWTAIAQPPGRRGGGRLAPGNDPSESLPPVMSPEQLIRQFDRNGDGQISREEAPPRMRERWDQFDTNHDGFITREELQARDDRVQRGAGPPQGRGEPDRPAPARVLPIWLLMKRRPSVTINSTGPTRPRRRVRPASAPHGARLQPNSKSEIETNSKPAIPMLETEKSRRVACSSRLVHSNSGLVS
jgi:hypothetical protein